MNEYLDRALEKLRGAKAPTGQREALVFRPVVAALEDFCRQDAEFAQAVVQGGSVEDCVKTVLKGVGNGVSDLEAYKRAAEFFFPGCVVEMKPTIYMSEHDVPDTDSAANKAVVLDLADFW